jgi:hypothetical protein
MIGSDLKHNWHRFRVSCQGHANAPEMSALRVRPLKGRVRHADLRAKILFENEERNSRRRTVISTHTVQYITSAYTLLEKMTLIVLVYRVLVRVVIAKFSVLPS